MAATRRVQVGAIDIGTFDNDLSQGIAEKIVIGETYPPVSFLTDIRTVIDIGANIGAASVYFHAHYPAAEIYAFEPGTAAFALLRRNVGNIEQVHALNFGLFDRDTRTLLRYSKLDSVTNSVGSSRYNRGIGERVQLRAAGRALAELGIAAIDILKVDTEGCEVPILRALGLLATSARAIYVEYHSETDRRDIDAMLGATHVLHSGEAMTPHRGQFCYVARSAFRSEAHYREHEIVLPCQ